jgi:hypothetical protein
MQDFMKADYPFITGAITVMRAPTYCTENVSAEVDNLNAQLADVRAKREKLKFNSDNLKSKITPSGSFFEFIEPGAVLSDLKGLKPRALLLDLEEIRLFQDKRKLEHSIAACHTIYIQTLHDQIIAREAALRSKLATADPEFGLGDAAIQHLLNRDPELNRLRQLATTSHYDPFQREDYVRMRELVLKLSAIVDAALV